MTAPLLSFVAYGRPVPQGAIRSLGAGRPSVHANADRLKPWRDTILTAAMEQATLLNVDRITTPVAVYATFVFDRPKSHWRTGKNAHLLRDDAPAYPCNRSIGDLDKLCRGLGDALCPTVLEDDSLIVTWRLGKRWADGSTPRAVVDIYPAPLP